VNQLQRFGGADSHTRGLSIGPALLAPVGRVDTQVALRGFVLKRIPDRPVRTLRTGLDTHPTANTFFLIDHPDVAMFSIYVSRSDRTILDAER
jgi:hypothetical protein